MNRGHQVVILATTVLILSSCVMTGAKVSPEMREFSEVINVPNKDKSILYVNVNEWFVNNFNSAESVIEFQDKESGKIMGKYTSSYSEGIHYYMVEQTISIDVKDSKIKLVFSNPRYKITGDALNGNYRGDAVYYPLEAQSGIDNARAEWVSVCASLKEFLTKESNW